jgi:LuxR family transcriptional regulator, quorum-sensing system regulator CciR
MTADHRRIFEVAAREGLADGLTIPADRPGDVQGSCSFAGRPGRQLPRNILPMAQLIGAFAFQAGHDQLVSRLSRTAPPRLTSRQLDCVVLLAKGSSNREIASALGLKEDTVSEYIDEARRRYKAKQRMDLVLLARWSYQPRRRARVIAACSS